MKIILASQSPRRKSLLKQMGLDFRVIPSAVSEEIDESDPIKMVQKLAQAKAQEVALLQKEGLVIGADTIVVFDKQILGKPEDEEDAFHMLSTLSGKEHQVITGVAVIEAATGKVIVAAEKTKVLFEKLTEDTIANYIATKEPMDKAGAYAIQGLGGVLVKRIEGCYFNVVGLPIGKLVQMLREFNIHVL